jgi:hypothetical protein
MMNTFEWILWTIAVLFGVIFNALTFSSDVSAGKINSFADALRSQLPTAIAFLVILFLIPLVVTPDVAPIGGRRR